MRRCVFRIALAGHLMLFAPAATAQDYRGRLQGTVLDSTQSALPGTTIWHRPRGADRAPVHLLELDTDAPVQHPTCMLILSRRFAALAAMLALCTGNLAVCAGWKATPEARMACCTDDTTCPMHESASHRSGSRRVVTQEQADSCCATSARNHTATTASDVVLFSTLTLAPSPVPVTLPILDFALAGRRSLVALPRASVPTHLLLSVFLV